MAAVLVPGTWYFKFARTSFNPGDILVQAKHLDNTFLFYESKCSFMPLINFCRSVDDIDLFVGGLAETHLQGATVGPTFGCLIGQTFQNLKYGDRFWYEQDGLFTKGMFSHWALLFQWHVSVSYKLHTLRMHIRKTILGVTIMKIKCQFKYYYSLFRIYSSDKRFFKLSAWILRGTNLKRSQNIKLVLRN